MRCECPREREDECGMLCVGVVVPTILTVFILDDNDTKSWDW